MSPGSHSTTCRLLTRKEAQNISFDTPPRITAHLIAPKYFWRARWHGSIFAQPIFFGHYNVNHCSHMPLCSLWIRLSLQHPGTQSARITHTNSCLPHCLLFPLISFVPAGWCWYYPAEEQQQTPRQQKQKTELTILIGGVWRDAISCLIIAPTAKSDCNK